MVANLSLDHGIRVSSCLQEENQCSPSAASDNHGSRFAAFSTVPLLLRIGVDVKVAFHISLPLFLPLPTFLGQGVSNPK